METYAGHGFCVRAFSSSHAFYRMDVCQKFQPFHKEEECCQLFNPASLKVVFTMAIATSIDALAVGISFAFLGVQGYNGILSPILIIGFVSFVLSLIGLIFGIQCGCGLARKLKAELWGGIILVIIGIKILIEHLFFQ